jgi:hypothetical protein
MEIDPTSAIQEMVDQCLHRPFSPLLHMLEGVRL